MQKFRITMDNPDGTLETIWEKRSTEKTMYEEFEKTIKAQQQLIAANPATKWRKIRVFDELGNQICQES
jgi:hypothetical protein